MYEYKVNILKVIDGDTVDVDIDLGFGVWLRNERVRLGGIDAPESRTSDAVEKVFGQAAKDRVSSLLGAEAILISQISKSGDNIKGVEKVYTPDTITAFANACDHVVNLMPDTPSTHNLLSNDFFSALKSHSVFINAGRGSAVDDEALLNALNSGAFAHAVLDVFREEPLDTTHPFWHHPNITITAHTAAESQPSDVADVFLDNAKRYLEGQPLKYQFDFSRGY